MIRGFVLESPVWKVLRQESRDTVTIDLFRYDPTKEAKPRREAHEIPFCKGMSILHVLKYVHDNIDDSLAFRYSCENELCGLCGVFVNGKPVLACREELISNPTVIDPLPGFPVIRDLAVDTSRLEGKMEQLFFGIHKPKKEVSRMLPLSAIHANNMTACIECHICDTVCNAAKFSSEKFVQPEGIVKLINFLPFPCNRKEKEAIYERLYYCTLCWECTEVCPRDVQITDFVLALRNFATKKGYFPAPFKRIVKSLFVTGHEFPFTGFTSKLRGQLCLSEKPQLAINVPQALEEVQRLMKLVGASHLLESTEVKD
ncbi:hypothetical protein A2W24_03765 [Microgenomates group bacterium RBG_16_45_19]|nr:MAG: hypothetical protein A2W24_03765 [Microgenomates group bacterium RBG_16_45_19]